MLNQKGQAFSVFELLIAAIVAVAILFVLLSILMPIKPPGNSGVVSAISNSLSAVKGGGSVESQPFDFEKDIFVTSNDFSANGFDGHSILFSVDPGVESMFTVLSNETMTGVQYMGAVKFTAKAFVACQATGTLLKSAIEGVSLNYTGAEVPGICGESEYQPCCLVIIKRG